MSDSDIINYINSYQYLRRSLETSVYLERNPLMKTSTNQMSSLVTQLKLLFEKFFGNDITITSNESQTIFDEELNIDLEVIFFNIEGYANQIKHDMVVESNFAPLLKQIIESIKVVDPKLYLDVNFEAADFIRLVLSSQESSTTLFNYSSEDDDDDNSSSSYEECEKSSLDEDETHSINNDHIEVDLLVD